MSTRWEAADVASCVQETAQRVRAAAVLTFDERGVSGHCNHVATHRGVLAWAAQQQQAQCWLLQSPSALRKFSGPLLWPLDAVRARLLSGTACFLTPSPGLAARALRLHASQAVWYRWLFIALGSCAHSNVLLLA